MEMAIVTNRPTFMNKELEKATLLIAKCDMTIKARQYDIADALAQIDAKELYRDDGFSSCAEYAMETFGIQKSTAYLLITIGKEYTRKVIDDKGRAIGHCSNLMPEGSGKSNAPVLDFTTNQIGIIASLGRDVITGAIERGELKPSMKASELREFVKLHKAIKANPEPDEAGETAEPAEPSEPSEPVNTCGKRSLFPDYNNIPSSRMIAELRARGYRIYREDGTESKIDWEPEQ